MANVKITDLTELAATDLATNDVLPIVDINNDSTKKVTIASLTGLSDANDFVTYTQLNANLDIVQDNVAAEATAIQSRLTTNVAITTAVEARRVANIAGAVSTITTGDLTASRALASDSSGKVAVSAVTSTELGHLDGVSSAIQTQINDINTRATANATSSGAADAVEARRVANIAGAVSTITTGDLTASRALASDGSGKVAVSAVTATELGYLDGVSSAIQTQINSKQATITGAATTIDDADLTASRAVVSDGSGKVAVSAVTATEVGYLDGVSSAIQTQLDAKAALAGATFTGDVTLTNTDEGSSASPIIVLDRQSASPADADYLGRIQFKGKDDGGANETYAQISGKIIDASATTEDGAIEFAVKKAGSQTIVGRLKSDKLLLLNGTELSVDGASEFTGEVTMTDDLVVTGNLTVNGATTTVSTTNLDVEDRMIMLADGVSGSPSADVGLLFNRGNQGNAAIFYDESAKTFKLSDTKDPKSNTSLSPVTASNLSVGIVDAATLKYDGLSVHTSIADNASVASAASTAVEARRVANIAGAISTVLTGDLTADRVMITNGSGKIAASSGVTPTELGYLDGLTLGTVAASKAVTADSNGDVNFIREVDIDGNVVIGTNASNTVTIVGVLDCGAFS